MMANFEKEKEFLRLSFAQPHGASFRRDGIIMFPQEPSIAPYGDFLCSDAPLESWLPWVEAQYRSRLEMHGAVGDDAVPYISLATHTGVFAAAFGCGIHVYGDTESYTPASALPAVRTASEAETLAEELIAGKRAAGLGGREFDRYFGMAELVLREFGPGVPISPVDIQSPFGIAAQVWEKSDFMMALYDGSEAARILIGAAERLLAAYLDEYLRRIPSPAFCHWPYLWTDPAQGLWLSEDDIGIISTELFETWSKPALGRLSERFSGLFMHCCAAADHQHESLCTIPGFRGINRFTEFTAAGMGPALRDFAGRLPIISNPVDEAEALDWLDQAPSNTRFILTLKSRNLEHAKEVFGRLRRRLDDR